MPRPSVKLEKQNAGRYEIVTANSPSTLVTYVNKKVEEGYRPLGGVVAVENNNNATKTVNHTYLQTMYKD